MGRNRDIAIGFGSLGAAIGLLAVLLLLNVGRAGAAAQEAAGSAFTGIVSCAGTNCHGRSAAEGPAAVGSIRGDEVALWHDPASPVAAHSRAFAVLASPRGREIARRLGLDDPQAAPACLACHATPAPAAATPAADGFGCESCHGPAGGWLASHHQAGATHADNVRRGLVPLENPRVRANVCLDCHYGSTKEGQFVDHRMMAAGHPRLVFELDLFTTLQQHHREDAGYHARKGAPNPIRTWAIGQAAALDRALTLFATTGRGTAGMFPEFRFFDCHSCHRPANEPRDEGNAARPIPRGMPAFNDENMIMLAAAAQVLAPQLAQRLGDDSRAFHGALAGDRISAVRAAAALRETVRALSGAFASAALGRDQAFAIVEAIAAPPIAGRLTDHAGAVQAVMAIDTLLSALIAGGHVAGQRAEAIRADINAAYQAVRDPHLFDASTFRTARAGAARAIGSLR